MTRKIMTSEEYINETGLKCPVCKSENIFRTGFDVNDNYCGITVVCCDCNSCWKEVYTLKEIKNVEIWTFTISNQK